MSVSVCETHCNGHPSKPAQISQAFVAFPDAVYPAHIPVSSFLWAVIILPTGSIQPMYIITDVMKTPTVGVKTQRMLKNITAGSGIFFTLEPLVWTPLLPAAMITQLLSPHVSLFLRREDNSLLLLLLFGVLFCF